MDHVYHPNPTVSPSTRTTRVPFASDEKFSMRFHKQKIKNFYTVNSILGICFLRERGAWATLANERK